MKVSDAVERIDNINSIISKCRDNEELLRTDLDNIDTYLFEYKRYLMNLKILQDGKRGMI